MSKHTGGTWEVTNEIQGLGGIVASLGQTVEDESYFVRSSVLVRDADLPANANLIAAAPELLEALNDAMNFARAALECMDMERSGPLKGPRFDPWRAAIAKAQGK